ncbi:hypothetical protein [uncultured Alistipes sp.]|uniref:hypothetical protein n=1 Tax=uncultured Alistipes sp. TaxID=538949 RepID=UPI0026258A17|nr:hypothetical protein [uncultured Alistipes sp.]
MKKLLLSILMLPGIVSCIDSEYDLSNIASDDTMIGTSTSEFRIPVARITITAGKLGSTGENDNGSILELYREADTWLPSTLPGGAEAVEVERLSDDGAYLQSLLDGTFDEMDRSAEKRAAVSGLVARKYKNEFAYGLPDDVPANTRQEILNATPEQAAGMIDELYTLYNMPTRRAISGIAGNYLANMRLKPTEYVIPALDLSSDVRDMLAGGGYLYGDIESELPFRMRIWPRYRILDGMSQPLDMLTVEPDRRSAIAEFQLAGTDFDNFLLGGMTFHLETDVERYYPARGIDEEQTLRITLKMRKTGGLEL